jgi:hypothetical protein
MYRMPFDVCGLIMNLTSWTASAKGPEVTDAELEAKYPRQPWRAVAGYAANPFMVNVVRGSTDTCAACQDFARPQYHHPDHVPATPLLDCTCDRGCRCEVR